jgi:hypothetical protein
MVYNDIKHVINHFKFQGEYEKSAELTSGNINATYQLTYKLPDGRR